MINANTNAIKFRINTEFIDHFIDVTIIPANNPPKIIPNSKAINKVANDLPLFNGVAKSLAQANKLGALNP